MNGYAYTFRDLLQLARTYQSLGFDRETIVELLHIARHYWKEPHDEGGEPCLDATE